MNELKRRIDSFVARLRREDVNMHGFILSVAGAKKATAYYAPFREGESHRMYSVSKTMTGIAVGILADEGKLFLDAPIVRYFEDKLPKNPDPRLLRLTIRDMLRMATCYTRTTYREGVDGDWAATFFTATPSHEPGTVFHYDTSCSQVLAALVCRLSGKQVIDFLEERVFRPLGATDEKFWLRDPSGMCQGGTGLCMSLRDLHTVSLALLRGGQGVIPRWYAEEMGKPHISTVLCTNEEERYGYGWQCWRTRAGYAMYGMGGQLAVICPEKQAILCTIADTRLDPVGVQRIYNAFFEEIYPYIGTEDTAPVHLGLSTHGVAGNPALSMARSPEYRFPSGNPLNLKTLRLEGDCLYYENARGQVTLPFAQGENKRIAYPGWPEVPALASGGWIGKSVLRVRCFAIGQAPCGFDMLLYFSENRVTVQSRCSGDPVTAGYNGVASGES